MVTLSDELRRIKEELQRQRERAAGSVPDAGPSDPRNGRRTIEVGSCAPAADPFAFER